MMVGIMMVTAHVTQVTAMMIMMAHQMIMIQLTIMSLNVMMMMLIHNSLMQEQEYIKRENHQEHVHHYSRH